MIFAVDILRRGRKRWLKGVMVGPEDDMQIASKTLRAAMAWRTRVRQITQKEYEEIRGL